MSQFFLIKLVLLVLSVWNSYVFNFYKPSLHKCWIELAKVNAHYSGLASHTFNPQTRSQNMEWVTLDL